MALNSETKVGILVFVCAIFMFITSIFLGSLTLFRHHGYAINVTYDTVGGLKDKAAVMFAEGVSIGSVESIIMSGEKAKVALLIRDDVKLRRDAEFRITTVGLMGEKYINVSGGSADAAYIEPGETIIGRESESLD
jgi:phospholipid/cholesterol/gamma-HCH transport system substrate-binding protein